MKKSVFVYALIIACFAIVHLTCAQQDEIHLKNLTTLPKNLKLTENAPYKYKITCDYFNGDIFGNFINKTRVTGEYTRGFRDGTVKWNNVKIATGDSRKNQHDGSPRLDCKP